MNSRDDVKSRDNEAQPIEWDARKDCLPLHEAAIARPQLRQYLTPHPQKHGRFIIDLGDPRALLEYNKALLLALEGLTFEIPEGSLIPSICLRRTILKVVFTHVMKKPPRCMLEIGIGRSAVIAMIAAKRWGVEVWGTDHEEALEWARRNITANGLNSHVHLVLTPKNSILKDLPLDLSNFDLILSNPPYYATSDINLIKDRGFLGYQQELMAGTRPESFANALLNEWITLGKPAPLAIVLPKKQWLSHLVVWPKEIHLIKAGTRRRFLLYFE